MRVSAFVLVILLWPLCGWAQSEAGTDEVSPDDPEFVTNPGGPEDDSYIHPETLTHRAGYERRADQASAANTINQLEEDDRLKAKTPQRLQPPFKHAGDLRCHAARESNHCNPRSRLQSRRLQPA